MTRISARCRVAFGEGDRPNKMLRAQQLEKEWEINENMMTSAWQNYDMAIAWQWPSDDVEVTL